MLNGKTALVTGSTSGIGLGMALALARQGARVMLNGFGDVDGALARVRQFDPRAVHDGADMSKPDQIEAMVRRCEKELGSLDILVNNAGFTRDGLAMRMKDADFRAVLDVDLEAPFRLARAATAPVANLSAALQRAFRLRKTRGGGRNAGEQNGREEVAGAKRGHGGVPCL